MLFSVPQVILSPIVTLSAASLHVLDGLLVFSTVSTDEPDGPGPGLEGPAAVGAHAARHLVRLDRAAAVWLDVVIPILFLLTIPTVARLSLAGLSATFSCLCNINNNQNSISGHNSVSDTGKITCQRDTKVGLLGIRNVYLRRPRKKSSFVTG